MAARRAARAAARAAARSECDLDRPGRPDRSRAGPAGEDVTELDSIPAGRINQEGPYRITVFLAAAFRRSRLAVGRSAAVGRGTHRKRTSVPLASPAPGPYRMNAALTRLERHERGIHAVSAGRGGAAGRDRLSREHRGTHEHQGPRPGRPTQDQPKPRARRRITRCFSRSAATAFTALVIVDRQGPHKGHSDPRSWLPPGWSHQQSRQPPRGQARGGRAGDRGPELPPWVQ